MFSSSDKFILNDNVLNIFNTTEKYSLIKDDIFKFNNIGANIIEFINKRNGVTIIDILDHIKSNYEVQDGEFEKSINDFISNAIA